MNLSRFDRKDPFSMKHSKIFAILLFICFAAFQSYPAQAQVQIYSYTGPAWNTTQCAAYGNTGCIDGYISGSVALTSVPTGYSGGVAQSQVASYFINATGIGSDSSLSDLSFTNVALSNGQFTQWQFQAAQAIGITGDISISSDGVSGGYDQAAYCNFGICSAVGLYQRS
jgi:hypothetical protein